jgi:streptogramin lyase
MRVSSVKAIVIAAAIVSLTSIAIITITRSNNMVLLPGFGSGSDNNNDNRKNMTHDLSAHVDTPYVKEFSMPNGTAQWYIGSQKWNSLDCWNKINILISFDPKQGRIKSSYPIPEGSGKVTIAGSNSNNYNGSSNHENNNKPTNQAISLHMVWSIVEDKDAYIWFTGGRLTPLLRFHPSTGKFDIIHSASAPMQMKVDQKTGDIWYTTFSDNKIGVIRKLVKTNMSNINNNSDGHNGSSSNNNNSNSSSISQYKVAAFHNTK